MSLERDRVFDYNSLRELKEEYARLLRKAKEISLEMEEELKEVSALEAKVPSDVKSSILKSSLDRAKIEKDIFDELITTLDSNIDNLLSNIPKADSVSSESMSKLTDSTRILTEIINNYKEFVKVDFSTIDGKEFDRALRKLKLENGIKFDAVDRNIKEALEQSKGLAVATAMYSKDPVNLATGNFSYEKADLEIQGTYPLEFRRTYNAIDTYKGVLGNQWIHNFEVHLNIEGGTIKVTREDGRVDKYSKNGNGEYISKTLLGQKLVEIKEDDELKGYDLILENQERYNFSKEGRLNKIVDINGNETLLIYEEDKLKRVSTLSGYIDFHYKDESLDCIKDCTGRKVSFSYENNNLKEVKLPNNTSFKYTYDIVDRLIDVISPRDIKLVTNEYDDISRTSKQIFPDGGIMEYKYLDDENLLELTEQNGNKILYGRDDKFRNNKVIYEDGEEISVYNSKNKLVSFTDKNGNKTRYSYDRKGNLTRIMNPLGEVMNFKYDSNNRLIDVINEEGISFKMEYDERGNISKMINPKGDKTSIKYNDKGQIISSIQADDSEMKFKYDDIGNLISLIYPNGGETKYEYNALNQVIKTISPNGNVTKYEYDLMGNIIKVTNSEGYSREYKYNKIGKVVEVIDFDDTIMKNEYNELGKISKLIDQEGNITEYEYDLMWNISKVKEANGSETLYLYNKLNQLSTIENGLGHRVNYEYDPNGNMIKLISPTKEETKIEYDELNRRKKVIEVDGYEVNYEYNFLGKIARIFDNKDNEILFEYDELGQLTKQIDLDGNETKFTYTELGNIKTITNPLGDTLKYKYYPGGVLREIMLPEGEKEEYFYDLNGNIIEKKIGDNISIKYEYNSLDQISKVINSDGTKREFEYTPGGLVRKIIDEKGNQTKFTYTKTGNIKSVIDALGNETKYEYDEVGNLTRLEQLQLIDENLEEANKLNRQNGLSVITRYQYDLIGNLTKIIDGEGNEANFIYDENNRVIKDIDKDGYVTERLYNKIGQIEKMKYDDGREVKFSYNSLRELIEVEDWLGKTKIALDKLGRTTSVTTPDNKKIGYEWNDVGQRTKLIYPDGKEAKYEYDKSQKLVKLISGENEFKYNYDEIGRLSEKIYPNDIVSKYNYNTSGVLKGLEYYKNGSIIEKHDYSYDEVGNKIGIRRERQGYEGIEELSYKYDLLNRLTEVIDGDTLLRKYRYDSLGNRIEKYENGETTKYYYNKLNQLTREELPEEVRTYEYDKRGNRIKEFKNDDLVKMFTFDSTDYMTGVWNKKEGTAVYSYNGLGNRVSQTLKRHNNSVEKVDYVLDLTRPYKNVLERKVNENHEQYLWDGDLLGTMEEELYLLDELGSPIRNIDGNGETKGLFSYDEFGINVESQNNLKNPFGYTGYEYDPISELNYAQARYYDQNQGRFISEDNIKGSIIYPDSLNDYTYAWNQPLDYVDLDGNVPIIIGIPDVNVEAVNKGIEIGTWGKNKIKSGVDWGKDKVKSGINWTKNKIKKHAGYKYSEEREVARGIDYREGEIRGNNFFVLTETRIEKIDGIIEHKRGFEINTPKVEKWRFRLPSFNLSYSDGAVSVGGDGGFRAFGREVDLSSALNIELGSDWDISGELEGAIDGTIYGGKTGFDGDGFYINGIGGGEFVDGFTLKSEREMYRKPIDWLKVKMGIAAIVLAAIIITNAWSLTTIPLIPVGERLVYEGSAAMIISYLFGQSNVAYGESLNYCEIE